MNTRAITPKKENARCDCGRPGTRRGKYPGKGEVICDRCARLQHQSNRWIVAGHGEKRTAQVHPEAPEINHGELCSVRDAATVYLHKHHLI